MNLYDLKPKNPENYKYSELTEKIIKEAFKVHTTLGFGFLENVYRNALLIRLKNEGVNVQGEFPIKVSFEGVIVGEFSADLLVENKVIVELKAVESSFVS